MKPRRVRLAEIEALAYVPLSQVDLAKISKDLTIEHGFSESGFEESEEDTIQTIELFDLSRKGLVGLPRSYFFSKYNLDYIDRTNKPKFDAFKYPKRITPRDAEQEAFIKAICDALRSPIPTQVQAIAATGSGKTASSIGAIAVTGIFPVLIGVHTNALKEQWLGSLKRKEGFRYFQGVEWTAKNVGIVQQEICDYKDKLVVIGMMPSLTRRDYGEEFYKYFSAVMIDEIHKLAAPTLSDFLNLIPAHILYGMTATRKEGQAGKIITAHLGLPKIKSKQAVLQPKVYRIKVEREQAFYGNSIREYLTPLIHMPWRNEILVKLIQQRGLARGKYVLLLSDRVKHLQILRDMLIQDGLDSKHFGLFVGEYETGKYKMTLAGVDKFANIIKHKRMAAFDTRHKAQRYADAWLQANKLEEHITRITREKIKPKPEYYDKLKSDSNLKVLGATYGIFDTGLNLPRLDMGIECSPRGNVTQAIGRILREIPGKPMPEWYSIWDKLYNITLVDIPGRDYPEEIKQYNVELNKLEKQRRKSYYKQHAKLIGIDNVEILYN